MENFADPYICPKCGKDRQVRYNALRAEDVAICRTCDDVFVLRSYIGTDPPSYVERGDLDFAGKVLFYALVLLVFATICQGLVWFFHLTGQV